MGLFDCHSSTRKCFNKLVLLIMRFVIFIIHQGLENIETFSSTPRLFLQDQDQDQDFYFKTKTIFHVLEAPQDQDSRLHPCGNML